MVVQDCLIWTRATTSAGYGLKWSGGGRKIGKLLLVHRSAWEKAHGAIPPGLFVCHHCDNPSCYNVDHLFLGTHADNMADMVAKGRNRGPRNYARGERHPRTRLTIDDVREIRRRRISGESLNLIASDFGISFSSVSSIARRRSWAWLD